MSGDLRNFDLTVEEIRVMRAIKELSRTLEKLESDEPTSSRIKFLRSEIDKLEERLDDIRDNTLTR